MSVSLTESDVEEVALDWLAGMGYEVAPGSDFTPEGLSPERTRFDQVVLANRLRHHLSRLNPTLPADALDDAVRQVTHAEDPSLIARNRRFHRLLIDGVDVQFRGSDGLPKADKVWLIDFDDPEHNEFLAVNQFTVIENKQNRRPDILLFINGLPLVVIELKNAVSEDATVRHAFNQIQTYKQNIPGLFVYNALCVASDGLSARAGTLTADWERFMPWRTIHGDDLAPQGTLEMETLLKGIFDKARFLDLLRHFIVFEDDGLAVVKKVAAYHQFHAANKAVACTVRASSPEGDRRVGVVWHTQGSGKSLSMVFYAGKVVRAPEMANPTVVVLTDRNDLDDQLFGTFARCKDLLRQTPVQADGREQLKDLLSVASGGVVFTTIQKFQPEATGGRYPRLSDRRNIVVIADEAHRSQYDFIDGFARNLRDALPNASFIGFTGTPIEARDRSTPAVFGDYIDTYDIQRAVEDGATVRIYYESRLAKIELDPAEKPKLDAEFEEVTEGEETVRKEKLKTKWAALESLVGAEKRVALLAKDLVDHFEKRQEVMEGKAMAVCMSRRICVDLYRAVVKLRPQWHSEDDAQGELKVVMTGSASDDSTWQPHIRNKSRREDLAKRFKNPQDPLRLVIVRDMWLTGFDCPSLHTLYADKPMRSHGFMQAIARVNRVFKDKPGGLVVDYLGLADQLKAALREYTESGGEGAPAFDQEQAALIFEEKFEVCDGLFYGFNRSKWRTGTPAEKLALLPAAQEFVLGRPDGKKRCLQAVTELSKAFALAVPHPKALHLRDDVGFFQAVRAALAKTTVEGQRAAADMDTAVQQLVSKAITSNQVIDLFAAAGLKNPDISILSDEFLKEVRALPHRNLAMELLRKLITGEVKARARQNAVQARSFSALLEKSIRSYQNRAIDVAQVINELIALAKELKAAGRRGQELGLSEDELAFYDALEVNDSAVKVLGDENLKTIARELVDTVRRNATIDWTVKANVRAKLRVAVKKVLLRRGYPPDKQEKAVQTVLEQAELLGKEWAGGV